MSKLASLFACLWLGTPANADLPCAEVFSLIGREPVATGHVDLDPFWAQNGPFECSMIELGQLVFDYGASDRAEDVVSADQLLGTWVSDNVLATYAGLFIPVYEVLTISPGSAEGQVGITQSLIRAQDPADTMGRGIGPVPLDVTAAGRIATYGEHTALLTEPGKLSPSRIRYHEFPIETDRSTSLAMKTGYLSVMSFLPIAVRTDGERLVFTMTERMARDGNRIMTFRKRRDALPEIGMLIAVIGNVSMQKFHCLLEAMDRPTEAYRAALGGIAEAEFFAALREADRLSIERQDVMSRFRSAHDKDTRDALAETARTLSLKWAERMETEPLAMLQREVESGAPFGCPNLY